ncbi:MAG TPA: hypothetical protein PLD86_19085 [Vicinamibacteria bacterium]|nr:hypothetical protein [Vicinamibacteria bacterium]
MRDTADVTFRQNIGLLVLRLSRKVSGRLCAECVEKNFWPMTLMTAFTGWWGIISFFVTPFYLLGNFGNYASALRRLFREGAKGPGSGREPWSHVSLALGVITLPALGFCGAISVFGLGIALVGLVKSIRRGTSVGPALLGLGCHGFFVLLSVLAILLANQPAPTARAGASPGASGSAAFDDASLKIVSYTGEEGFGNTPEAAEMAKKFSVILNAMGRFMFTGGREDDKGTLTQGHFLTYAEVRADSICFLVHVPELRSYQGEVREALLDIAWTAAREAALQARPGTDLRVGVGLRGILLYGAVAVGTSTAEKPARKVFDSTVPTELLHPFFTGPLTPSPSPTPSASLPDPGVR